MHRLPVMATVGASYRFLARNAGTILRLAWFPLLIVAIAGYFDALTAVETVLGRITGSPAAGGSLAGIIGIATIVVSIAGGAMVGVALHRLILFGDDKPGTYILFSIGKTELLFMVIPALVAVALFAVGFLVATGAGPPGGRPSPLLTILAIAAVILVLYFSARLAPFYPIIVVEDRFDFRHAFDLSRGNFWRIAGVIALGWIVPLTIVLVVTLLLGNPLTRTFLGGLTAGSSAADLARAFRSFVMAQSVIGYVFSIVAAALTVALICFIYKGLRGFPPDHLLTREYEVR